MADWLDATSSLVSLARCTRLEALESGCLDEVKVALTDDTASTEGLVFADTTEVVMSPCSPEGPGEVELYLSISRASGVLSDKCSRRWLTKLWAYGVHLGHVDLLNKRGTSLVADRQHDGTLPIHSLHGPSATRCTDSMIGIPNLRAIGALEDAISVSTCSGT